MKLVVTGTRNGRPDVAHWLDRWVRKFGRPELVILGDARGVDTQARGWAIDHGYPYRVLRAQWGQHYNSVGKDLGGFLRNQEMVDLAQTGDWCVGFPGDVSPGTYDCLRRAKARGLFTIAVPLVGQP